MVRTELLNNRLSDMRSNFKFLLISAVIPISFSLQAQPGREKITVSRPTVVSLHLKPSGSITFQIFDVYMRQVVFKNRTDRDTVITKTLFLYRPSLLTYNSMLMLAEGPLLRSYPVLLAPGDSVTLQEEKDSALSMRHSSGYSNFVDSIISVPKKVFWPDLSNQQQQLLKTIGLKGIAKNIARAFDQNEVTIKKLKLSNERAGMLQAVNSHIKYKLVADLLSDPAVGFSALTDSLYNEMYKNAEAVWSLDNVTNGAISGALIGYNAKKRNRSLNKYDTWACAFETDEQLKQTDFYKKQLVTMVATNFIYSPEETEKISQRLGSVPNRSAFLDTIYQLSQILSETFTNFNQAKQKLKAFAGGKYSFIIEDDEKSANHEVKTISNLPFVALNDFAGKTSDFKQIVMNDKYKLTLVDFWASWCIPCLSEMPKLKTIEHKLKDKPIQFVTISIDIEEDVDKWVTVAKRNDIFSNPSQYRLVNFKKSPLTALINLKTIPRYLIIDNKGNILNDDFYRPSEERFLLELTKRLN